MAGGKIFEIAFNLAGKLGASFSSTFLSAQKQINGLEKEMKRVRQEMKKAGADTNKLTAEMQRLGEQKKLFEASQQSADKFKQSASSAFRSVAATAAIATTAITGYYGTAIKLANGVMAQSSRGRTGTRMKFGFEAYQELDYAAKKIGLAEEDFDKAMRFFSVNLAKAKVGAGGAAKEFARLGLDAEKLSAMAPEKAFTRIAQYMKELPDNAARMRLAVSLFGRDGIKMVGMLNLGEQGLKEFGARAREAGLIVDEEAANQARKYKIMKSLLTDYIAGAKMTVGKAILPALTQGMGELAKLIEENRPAIKLFAENFAAGLKDSLPHVLDIVKGLRDIASGALAMARVAAFAVGGFDNLVRLAGLFVGYRLFMSFWQATTAISASVKAAKAAFIAFQAIGGVTRIWAAAQWALNAAMLANPIGLALIAIAALAAAAYLVIKNWDKVKTFFSGLFGWIIEKWEAVKATFSGAVAAVGNAMAGGGTGVPVPMMASGGIVNRPTLAMIGEAGPEAVVPLSRMGGMGSPITINQVFHVSGGNRDDVAAAVSMANGDLLRKLQSLQDEEARLSYAF